ncbi:MAG: serine/threonine-protein phosphatase [Actinobacteria bacterium]|nr:serine/threonine-protein phosphatase [Actinomycetota bacterium]
MRAAAIVDRDPAAVLSNLDAMIKLERGEGDPVRFCTVAYAQLERLPEGARLTVANGSHPAVYVFRHGGQIESIEHTGPLIGCVPEARFTTVALTLTPGDTVLFYTDGLPDSRLDGRWLGDEGVPAHLLAHGPLSATALVAELQTLLDRCDLPQRDDVALLAVSICAAK